MLQVNFINRRRSDSSEKTLRTLRNPEIVKFRVWIFLTLIGCFSQAYSQRDTTGLVKYTPGFKFEEGIFLNFDQLRQNKPIPKSRIITTVLYDDPDFYERVLQEKKVQVFDNLGTKQEFTTKNIWGFSRNGVLYINLNEGYYRITIVGSICHFVANLTTYNNNYNPYSSYGYPYYGNPYNPYSPYYSPYSNSGNTEMRQYLLDFKTGNVMEYDVESVQLLLMTDPTLHDEFASLRNKKQKQLKFLYIRKFNERNPLYFPENQ
jgi:hypothetical protein